MQLYKLCTFIAYQYIYSNIQLTMYTGVTTQPITGCIKCSVQMQCSNSSTHPNETDNTVLSDWCAFMLLHVMRACCPCGIFQRKISRVTEIMFRNIGRCEAFRGTTFWKLATHYLLPNKHKLLCGKMDAYETFREVHVKNPQFLFTMEVRKKED